jgi:predicted flap endonuclease-1-like 5' DNA nuclease
MDLTSFLIGLVIGLIIALIVWYLDRRKLAGLSQSEAAARQQLAEAQNKLRNSDATLASERTSHQTAIAQVNSDLGDARSAAEALRAQLAAADVDCQQRVADLDAQLVAAHGEIEDLRGQLSAAALANQTLQEQLAAGVSEPTRGSFDALAGAIGLAADEQGDDLTLIEGIGPKIATLLNQAGIHSFRQLSQASVQQLQEILDAAGPHFRVANPRTWAIQAHMAAAGLMDELKALQDTLAGGVKR